MIDIQTVLYCANAIKLVTRIEEHLKKKKKKERKKERKKNLIHKYMPINKTTQVKTHLVLTKSSMYPPMLFSMYLPMLLIIFCFPFRNKRLYVRVSFNSNSKKGIKNNWKFDENVL